MMLTFWQVARIGVNAAIRSILRDFVVGQTGNTRALRNLKRDDLANIDMDAQREPACILPGQREIARACVRPVLTALRKRARRMNRIQLGRARKSAARVARVLRAVCFGDSLAVACERFGYGWDAARSRSMGFNKALASLGLSSWVPNRIAVG